MTGFHHRLPALILTQLLACCLVGCGVEKETKVPAVNDTAAPEASPGPAAGAEPTPEVLAPGQLPGDFPADVPHYPGASVQQSFSVPNDSVFVSYTTSASTDEVFEFYRKQLENRGWKISKVSKESNRFTATKPGRTASIIAFARGAITEIGVSIKSE